jgi:hypothetical protein
MPLLPTKNTLDFNPNSIINASKSIKTISLENMKNPVLDPDMKTLSTMDAERDLNANLGILEQMYLGIDQDIMRMRQIANTSKVDEISRNNFLPQDYYTGAGRRRGKKLYGGAGGEEKVRLVIDEDTPTEIIPPQRPRGRPAGSKNKPKTEAPRFSSSFVDDARNSQANPYGDPDDEDPDDDTASLPSSISSGSRTSRSFGYPYQSVAQDPDGLFEDPPTITKTISSLLFGLVSKVQKIDFFLVSRIKPAYNKLSASQQDVLGKLLVSASTLYRKFVKIQVSTQILSFPVEAITSKRFPFGNEKTMEKFIYFVVENGDDVLRYLKESVDKLVVDLTVVLNASRQVSSGGMTTVNTDNAENYALRLAGYSGAGRPVRLIGSGRNFYGDTINDTRDIPTIRRSYQDCPTKYLL